MIAVDSLDEPRVAAYRWVARPEQLARDGLFVAEGRLVVPRLLALSASPGRWAGTAESILLSPAAFDQMRDQLAPYRDVSVFVAPQAVIDGLVGFNMHRGCLALARRPPVETLDANRIRGTRLLVVLEGVNNPDNVGGIFRSAAALGADLVVLGPACADPLYRKCVRTSMGATMEVPYATAPEWPGALETMRAAGAEVVALTTDAGAAPLGRFAARGTPVVLLAGAEGTGLSGAALAHADVRVTIPMTGRVDSLNVATAVSIGMYHMRVSERS